MYDYRPNLQLDTQALRKCSPYQDFIASAELCWPSVDCYSRISSAVSGNNLKKKKKNG